MEQNIANYYQKKRRKKKINKIKTILVVAVFFIIILFGRDQILKSTSSYVNENQENNVNNQENNVNNQENNVNNQGNNVNNQGNNVSNQENNVNNQGNNVSNQENNVNNQENILEYKEEKASNSSDKINNENNTNSIEQKENWKTANEDYFNDAVFIGDSRTEGFILNNGLTSKVTSFTHKGLTVDTIFTDKVINMRGKKITIMEALKETKFSKVYIMLGINETGWVYSHLFINKYAKIVDEIKNINPNCTIYIQSIIPVTEQVSNEHQYIKNSKIEEYNFLLKKLADEKNICYLNIQEAVINENGILPNDAATDGIHLNKKYCEKWFEYLKEHTK